MYYEIFGPSIQAEDAKAELTQKAQEYENQLKALRNKVMVSLQFA